MEIDSPLALDLGVVHIELRFEVMTVKKKNKFWGRKFRSRKLECEKVTCSDEFICGWGIRVEVGRMQRIKE